MELKKIILILCALALVFAGIGITKDLVIKNLIILAVSGATAAPASIDWFSLGLFSRKVKISGFSLYNPSGFSPSKMVYLSSMEIVYDAAAILRGRLHLPYARIELTEMGVEKNKNGRLNADSLKIARQENSGKPAKEMPIQIDSLDLIIGKVVSRDYSSGEATPAISVYEININKTYKNISSVQQLAALIVAEPMKVAGIQGAAIYGVAALTGVAVLPVAVAATFAGRDSVEHDFRSSFDAVYKACVDTLEKMGRLTSDDRGSGIIEAEVNGVKINVKVGALPGVTNVKVSARKYMLPKPAVAAGVLYKITEKVK